MNRFSTVRRRTLGEEGGFTIVELMVSITIFALLMGAAAIGLANAFTLTRNDRSRSVAANLASQQMDVIRAQDFITIPIGGPPSTFQTVDSVKYTIDQNTEWVDPKSTGSPCSGGSGVVAAYLRVTVFVTWPNMAGADPVTTQTVIAPPVGTYNANTGNVGVVVRDRNAAPEDAVAVTLSTTPPQTEFTTPDGCAFFAFVPVGTFTATLAGVGFVDGQGITSPSQSVTVVAGSDVSSQFDFDRSAGFTLNLVGAGGGSVPANMPISLGNSHLTPSGLDVFPGTGTPRSVGGEFPYTDGYQAWAGDCFDADPQAVKTGFGAIYPGQSRDAAMASPPGGLTVGQVNMETVQVVVKKTSSGGSAVVGATVKIVHMPLTPADNGCPSGETLTLTGVTDSNGTILAAIPYGTWSFQVVGKTAVGSWPAPQIAPPAGNTTVTVVTV